MYYFINNAFTSTMSGIGHAQLKRFFLFKQNRVPVKLITTDFDLRRPKALEEKGISPNENINMFDFFGGMVGLKKRSFTFDDLNISKEYAVENVNLVFNVRKGNRLILKVEMFSDDTSQVKKVTYYDKNGATRETDWWDPRGFKILEQYYNKDEKIDVERGVNQQGVVFYETYHFGKKYDKSTNCLYRILNYHGYDYEFDGFKEMATFFFDELIKYDRQNGENDIFVNDASLQLGKALLDTTEKSFKLMQLHNNHTNDADEPLHSSLNFNYEYTLRHFSKWQGVTAPTQTQVTNVVRRFGKHPETFLIPVGVIEDKVLKSPQIPISKRHPNEIVMIARLSPEKRINHAVQAMEKVLKVCPNVQLNIYGYANGKIGDEVKQLVKEKHLTDSIHFKGYVTDIRDVYENAQLSILTSTVEGLPLSLIEAQSYGVPLISYDINYGPRDVINDGKDGYLVKGGDIDEIAKKIIKVMSDDELRQKLSRGAYEDRNKYSSENVWHAWEKLDVAAHNYFNN